MIRVSNGWKCWLYKKNKKKTIAWRERKKEREIDWEL